MPGNDNKTTRCKDCGTLQSERQREYDLDCQCGGAFREEAQREQAGGVGELVATWRGWVENRHTDKHGPEACVSCQDILACADSLEAALLADPFRQKAIALASGILGNKDMLNDNRTLYLIDAARDLLSLAEGK